MSFNNIESLDKKRVCVISKEAYGEYGIRDIQTNSAWTENPYGEAYAIVPESMIENILDTRGFCDIVLNDNETEVVSYTAKPIPEMTEPQEMPTMEERLAAVESAMLEMIGVENNA